MEFKRSPGCRMKAMGARRYRVVDEILEPQVDWKNTCACDRRQNREPSRGLGPA
jgi:hypothetical protein